MPTEPCNLCGKVDVLSTIYKQIAGEFKRFSVCNDCKQEHEKELEMTRQNFKTQFGDR